MKQDETGGIGAEIGDEIGDNTGELNRDIQGSIGEDEIEGIGGVRFDWCDGGNAINSVFDVSNSCGCVPWCVNGVSCNKKSCNKSISMQKDKIFNSLNLIR